MVGEFVSGAREHRFAHGGIPDLNITRLSKPTRETFHDSFDYENAHEIHRLVNQWIDFCDEVESQDWGNPSSRYVAHKEYRDIFWFAARNERKDKWNSKQEIERNLNECHFIKELKEEDYEVPHFEFI